MSPRSNFHCFLLLATLVAGCANTPLPGTGGSGRDPMEPAVSGPSEKDRAEAVRAEAAQVAAEVWAVASGVRDVGSQLELTFWSEHGALTLTGYTTKGRGGTRGRPASESATRRAVAEALESSVQQRTTGEIVLTLWRRDASWDVSPYASSYGAPPPEARKVPGRRGAFAPGQDAAIAATVQQWLKPVEVPSDGAVWVDLDVSLRDGQVVGQRLEGWRIIRAGRGGKPRPVAPHVASEVARVLRLYTPGTGPRTVRLGLRLSHDASALAASGWVDLARTSPSP
ncbi:MAG TPA: hypothetical protein VE153_25180 [Myxococcus sp.]|nr:hypothetical protein [Myxococcus sp.]